MQSDPYVFLTGTKCKIAYAVREDGTTPAKEFLDEQTEDKREKLLALFQRMANFGEIRNVEKFKHVQGKIFGFKSHQIRIPCYRAGDTWYLTHGFVKKKYDWRTQDVDLAETIQIENDKRIKAMNHEQELG